MRRSRQYFSLLSGLSVLKIMEGMPLCISSNTMLGSMPWNHCKDHTYTTTLCGCTGMSAGCGHELAACMGLLSEYIGINNLCTSVQKQICCKQNKTLTWMLVTALLVV